MLSRSHSVAGLDYVRKAVALAVPEVHRNYIRQQVDVAPQTHDCDYRYASQNH